MEVSRAPGSRSTTPSALTEGAVVHDPGVREGTGSLPDSMVPVSVFPMILPAKADRILGGSPVERPIILIIFSVLGSVVRLTRNIFWLLDAKILILFWPIFEISQICRFCNFLAFERNLRFFAKFIWD